MSLVLSPSVARATYSIAAVDALTERVGGAAVSCVGELRVSVIQGVVPGVGVVHAQARLNAAGRDRATKLMAQGVSATEVVDAITNEAFDPSFQERQFGLVLLPKDALGFTGSETKSYAAHLEGAFGAYRYSIQGNLLTSEQVLLGAQSGFERSDACGLAERLMLALEFAARSDEGDRRCTVDGLPGDSGFLRVVDNQGADVVFIEVSNTAPLNPVGLLRQAFDAWRQKNLCDQDLRRVQGANEGSSEVEGREGGSKEQGLSEGAEPQNALGSGQERDAAFEGMSMGEAASSHSASDGEGKSRGGGCAWARAAQSNGWMVALMAGLLLIARRRRQQSL